LALLVSVLLHFLFLWMGAYLSVVLPLADLPPELMKKEDAVEVTLYPQHGYQIADIAPPAVEERPDDAKFLGMYDSKVNQEVVAPTSGPSSKAEGGKKASHKEVTEKAEKADKVQKAKVAAPQPAKEGYHLAAKPDERKEKKAPKEQSGSADSGQEAATDGNDLFEGLSDDFFPDYKVGDRTYLNVLKYPKIGYFVRMKKIFRTTFNPGPAIRQSLLSISKGQIEVVLGVTIDKSGKLSDLMVIRSSGNPAYDQEAQRTIRDSSPFAAPPAEFIKGVNSLGRASDGPGVLRMAWTFTVYL